jgi:hypothetical protein
VHPRSIASMGVGDDTTLKRWTWQIPVDPNTGGCLSEAGRHMVRTILKMAFSCRERKESLASAMMMASPLSKGKTGIENG